MPQDIVLTPDERVAYPYLFSNADSDQLGVLVGEKAVAFFSHSKLPPAILGEIWQLADDENAGFLTKDQFNVALRLIGKAQRGAAINKEAISLPGPLARLEGFTIPGLATPQSPMPTGVGTAAIVPVQGTGGSVGGGLWTISPEEKAKYSRLFAKCGPSPEGLLDGDKARDMFIKSKLTFDKLGQIWNLADTQHRGSLSLSDFTIAMHLIQLSMSNQLSSLPAMASPELLASASSTTISQQMTGQTQPGSPLRSQFTGVRPQYSGQGSAIPPQMSGTGSPDPASRFTPNSSADLGAAAFGVVPTSPAPPIFSAPAHFANIPWQISATELVASNQFFDSLDTSHKGFISGDLAVPFLMESKLPSETLAKIWDLADIKGEGRLGREEFAIAMRLVKGALGSGGSVPERLEAALVPPSLRPGWLATNGVAPAGVTAQPQQSPVHRDLLDLLDDESPTVASSSPPAAAVSAVPSPPSRIGSVHASTLMPQMTGTSVTSQGRSKATLPPPPMRGGMTTTFGNETVSAESTGHPAVASRGGFGDNFSEPFDDSGAKLGNLHNQLVSTERSVSSMQAERGQLEQQRFSTTAQVADLELKLSAAKAAYETESSILVDLKARQVEQSTMLAKLKEDTIRAESDLSAIRVEKTEVEGALLRDKEEVRDMKKKMGELNEETARLKWELEQAKKEARQQRGMVAIGKKQLATSEGHRDAVAKELEATRTEDTGGVCMDVSVEEGAANRVGEASGFASPALSTTSNRSLNPFERMMGGRSTQELPPIPADAAHIAAGVGVEAGAAGAASASALTTGQERKEVETMKEEAVPPATARGGAADDEDPFTVVHEHQPAAAASFDDAFGFDDTFGSAPTAHRAGSPDGSTSLVANAVPVALPQHAAASPATAERSPPAADPTVQGDESSDEEEVEDVFGASSRPFTSGPSRASATLASVEDKFPALDDILSASSAAPLVTDAPSGSASDSDQFHNIGSVPSGGFPMGTSNSAALGLDLATADGAAEPTTSSASLSKRAAPPPPYTRGATPKSGAAASHPSAPVSVAGAFSNDYSSSFDDAFGTTPAAATAAPISATKSLVEDSFASFDDAFATSTPLPAAGGAPSMAPALVDDFESSFADLPPPALASKGATGSAPATDHFSASFDDSFDTFNPTFEVNEAKVVSNGDVGMGNGHVNDAFRAAYPASSDITPVLPVQTNFTSSAAATASPILATVSSAVAPKGDVRGAKDSDSDAVKQLCAMGFSRQKVIAQLEADDFDVVRATNHLLGS